MLIRIPIPGVEYVIEFDSDKIDTVHMPHEVADSPPELKTTLTGRSSLILRFATLDDAPKWTKPANGDQAAAFDPDTREICETLRQYLNDRCWAGLASPGVLTEVRPSADGSVARFALGWDDAAYVIEVHRSAK